MWLRLNQQTRRPNRASCLCRVTNQKTSTLSHRRMWLRLNQQTRRPNRASCLCRVTNRKTSTLSHRRIFLGGVNFSRCKLALGIPPFKLGTASLPTRHRRDWLWNWCLMSPVAWPVLWGDLYSKMRNKISRCFSRQASHVAHCRGGSLQQFYFSSHTFWLRKEVIVPTLRFSVDLIHQINVRLLMLKT